MAAQDAVIFPTDFSEMSLAALPWAKKMATFLGGRIHCVYVVEEPQIYATLDMGPVPIPSASELASTAQTRLDGFAQKHLQGLDQPAVAKVLVGRPADEIVTYARDNGAGVIIMTTHGYSGVKHVLLGSTTEAVLRHANCPVLSIRND